MEAYDFYFYLNKTNVIMFIQSITVVNSYVMSLYNLIHLYHLLQCHSRDNPHSQQVCVFNLTIPNAVLLFCFSIAQKIIRMMMQQKDDSDLFKKKQIRHINSQLDLFLYGPSTLFQLNYLYATFTSILGGWVVNKISVSFTFNV